MLKAFLLILFIVESATIFGEWIPAESKRSRLRRSKKFTIISRDSRTEATADTRGNLGPVSVTVFIHIADAIDYK
jgi:hypothetical protein